MNSKINDATQEKLIRIKGKTEPWMSSKILDLMQKRDKMLSRSIRNKSNLELREQYNFLRNKVTKTIREAKANYFCNKIKENKDNAKKITAAIQFTRMQR